MCWPGRTWPRIRASSATPAGSPTTAELSTLLEAALAQLTADQVTERLDEVGIANARLRTMAEFAEHPQLEARDRWRDVDSPVGPLRSLLPPVTVPGRESAMGPVPAIGQHTDAIRAEFASGRDRTRRQEQS
ncbi:CoA transferase [Modestobacter sp. DSM 44400]|uniref:CoA transferase n=1 Tax=Modestobacter sp. DSM 44400 TaxID=1550230 RepID=UPI00352AB817